MNQNRRAIAVALQVVIVMISGGVIFQQVRGMGLDLFQSIVCTQLMIIIIMLILLAFRLSIKET